MATSTSFEPINLTVYVGADVQTATAALIKAGLQVSAPLQVAGPLAAVYQVVGLSSQAWPGAVVQPVTLGTTVMGFKIDPQAQIQSLQTQVRQLQGRIVGQAAARSKSATPPKSATPQRPPATPGKR